MNIFIVEESSVNVAKAGIIASLVVKYSQFFLYLNNGGILGTDLLAN